MKTILLALLTAVPFLVSATSLDMNTLACRGNKLNASTTLADVRRMCLVTKQWHAHDGMYKLKFVNSTTNKKVVCSFPTENPMALLNNCK